MPTDIFSQGLRVNSTDYFGVLENVIQPYVFQKDFTTKQGLNNTGMVSLKLPQPHNP